MMHPKSSWTEAIPIRSPRQELRIPAFPRFPSFCCVRPQAIINSSCQQLVSFSFISIASDPSSSDNEVFQTWRPNLTSHNSSSSNSLRNPMASGESLDRDSPSEYYLIITSPPDIAFILCLFGYQIPLWLHVILVFQLSPAWLKNYPFEALIPAQGRCHACIYPQYTLLMFLLQFDLYMQIQCN